MVFDIGRLCAAFGALLLVTSATNAQEAVNVPAGKRTLVGEFALYNTASCAGSAVPEAKLGTAPKNGKLEFAMEQRRGNAGRCGNITIWSRTVYYTPNPGFRGQDSATVYFVYELFGEGSEFGNQSRTYSINVR